MKKVSFIILFGLLPLFAININGQQDMIYEVQRMHDFKTERGDKIILSAAPRYKDGYELRLGLHSDSSWMVTLIVLEDSFPSFQKEWNNIANKVDEWNNIALEHKVDYIYKDIPIKLTSYSKILGRHMNHTHKNIWFTFAYIPNSPTCEISIVCGDDIAHAYCTPREFRNIPNLLYQNLCDQKAKDKIRQDKLDLFK